MNPDQRAPESTESTGIGPVRRRGRLRRKALVAGVIVIASLASATVAYASTRNRSELERVRKATTKYHDVAVATGAGYAKLIDVNGISCIDMPGLGAMGV